MNFTLTKGTTGISGYTIYYCKDTANTCNPTTKATSGTQITSYNIETGTYYFRYKIVSESGISSSIGSFVAKIDTTQPTVTYSIKSGKYDTYQTVRITPSDENYDYMKVYVYNNEALVYTNKVEAKSTNKTTGLYYDVTLDEIGKWTIYTMVFDKAGNSQNQAPNNNNWYYQAYEIGSPKYILTITQTGGSPINASIKVDNTSIFNGTCMGQTKTFEIKAGSTVEIGESNYTLSDQCIASEHPKAGKLYGKIYSTPGNINVDGISYDKNPYAFTMPKKNVSVTVSGKAGTCTPDASTSCRFSCYASAISSCENVTPASAQTSCMNGYTEGCYKNC